MPSLADNHQTEKLRYKANVTVKKIGNHFEVQNCKTFLSGMKMKLLYVWKYLSIERSFTVECLT